MYDPTHWQPSATNETLHRRARLLRDIREFFWQHDVMEVDTQTLSLASISDPHIDVLTTKAKCLGKEQTYYLQTSPEFAMKRLLCSDIGDIYQLGKVFRSEEQSQRHSIEFTMLEWYRVGVDHWQLMYEIEALLVNLTQDGQLRCQFKSYQEAFEQYVGIDPFTAELADLQQLAYQYTEFGLTENNYDNLLTLLFSTLVEPNIGQIQPCFIHSYPANQAALARKHHNQKDQPVAARFELYWQGMELANGYHELVDATEQEERMQADKLLCQQVGAVERHVDERLSTALKTGLPACAGVALGVDRLLMLLLGVDDISLVVPFAGN